MLFRSTVIAFSLLLGTSHGKHLQSTRTVVAYARSLDVATLDHGLSSQPLAQWLEREAHLRNVNWSVSNCCDCDTDDGRLCVRFAFDDDGVQGVGIVKLGSRKHGIEGSPHLESLEVGPVWDPNMKLSELPKAVAKQSALMAYGKNVDVARLDPNLPSQPFEEWLRKGPARATKLEWGLSGCQLKDDPAQPLCVDFRFEHAGIVGSGNLRVGTRNQGVTGAPQLEILMLSDSNNPEKVVSVTRLSSLADALARLGGR